MKADAPLARRAISGHGDVRPFICRAVPEHAVEPINRFHGREWRVSLRLGGREIALSAAAPGLSAHGGDCLPLILAIGSEEVELLLPHRLAMAALASFGVHDAAAKLDLPRKALLIEAACAEMVAGLEARLGEAVELRALSGMPGGRDLRFALSLGSGADPVEIAEVAGSSGILTRLFALLPEARTLPGWLGPVPVPGSLRLADVRITLGELKRARPGDILLFDRHLPNGDACLLLGRHLVAPIRIDGRAARLQVAPAPARSSRWEWLMDDPAEDGSASEGAAALDDLPVRIVFEFGRSDMTLKELSGLGAGSIVTLPTSADEPLTLLVNGRRIGEGEPVRVGKALGVRITRLFDA